MAVNNDIGPMRAWDTMVIVNAVRTFFEQFCAFIDAPLDI
jgi:hypothetical protein